jgi:hypothetical protein
MDTSKRVVATATMEEREEVEAAAVAVAGVVAAALEETVAERGLVVEDEGRGENKRGALVVVENTAKSQTLTMRRKEDHLAVVEAEVDVILIQDVLILHWRQVRMYRRK